jgi:general secretion pathway protein E/type IV pilus assembly protein PilB
LGIYELLVSSQKVREMAHDRKSSWDVRKVAIEDGMETLREDGWNKAIDGRTSLDEVLRVTKGDRL